MSGGHFRISVWDPCLIIWQMIALQALFYFSFGALLIMGSFLSGTELSLYNIFNYKAMNFNDRHGILILSAYTINALIGSFGLWYIVKRTKQCLDFTGTVYLIHLTISWLYNGFLPASFSWWLLTIASVTIMCICGEFLCIKTEMEDIPLLGAKVDL